MPSKKKANNDESRAEDLPALDSVTEDAPAAHSSRSTATAIAPANVRDDKESVNKEVAEIRQLLDTGTDYSELVRLRVLLRVTNNCERLSDDLIRSLLKKFQVSERGHKKTLLKRLQHIVDPPPDEFKQMDADQLSGKKTSNEQLVSYYFETHGYLPVINTTKKDLAKEIIAARSGGLNFYLDLSYNQIKDILVNKYGRRYHNLTVQRKTLVDHLRAIEVKNANVSNDLSPSSVRPAPTQESDENKPDDWIRRITTEQQNEIIDLMEEEEEESRDDLRVDFVAPSTPPPQYLRPDPSPSNVDTAPKDTRPMKKKNEPNNSPENQSPLVPLNDEAGAAGLGNGRSVDTRPDPPSAGNSTRFGPKGLPAQTQDGGNIMNIDEHTNDTQWKGEQLSGNEEGVDEREEEVPALANPRSGAESLKMQDEVTQAADTLQINQRIDQNSARIDQNSARIGRLEDWQRTISKSLVIKNKNLEEENERLRNENVVLKRRLDVLTPLESD